jgi:hypothetical protein
VSPDSGIIPHELLKQSAACCETWSHRHHDHVHGLCLVVRQATWCALNATGEWRYRIYMTKGVIAFDFADQNDADAFRAATSRSPNLITCQ